jgi:quercetin dioxygenase-like cupin family protein
MKTFPDFIKSSQNKVDASQQNTDDIEGYYFQGADDTQIAFWECHADRISKKHAHPFDEYMVCVSGEYTAYLDEQEIVLKPGDELYIPKGTEQWGKCIAGTRTIHAFGGKRIKSNGQI